MSFASKVLYEGDGSTKSYNIPMPYIAARHLKVFIDSILQLNPMNYTLSGASTILFVEAPGDGSAVEIKRITSPNDLLVDFQDGSVLNESDLDLAYLHNYYLTQEYADSFNEVINEVLVRFGTSQGIETTDPDLIITDLVTDMLDSANAANLQARITDIDANAEAIITLGEGLQVQINTLASGVAAAVYIQPEEPIPGVDGIPDPITDGARWYDSDDNNAPYIYVLASLEWVDINDPRIGNNAADIAILYVDTGDNAAAVVAEAVVRSDDDSAIASELHLIGAQNAGKTAFIIDLDTAKVGPTESLADRFSSITADFNTNSGRITDEASVAATATGVVATTMSLIGVENAGKTAFILDENTVKIDSDTGDTLAERFTGIGIDIDGNSGNISTIQTVTIPEAEGRATDVADAAQGAADSAQTDADTANSEIAGIVAEYGVDIDVNGYISGFRLINRGTPGASAFVILADKFAVVTPDDPWLASTAYALGDTIRPTTPNDRVYECTTAGTTSGTEPTWTTTIGNTNVNGSVVWTCRDDVPRVPFSISGDKITMRGDVDIDGDLIVSGTINGRVALSTDTEHTLFSEHLGADIITAVHIDTDVIEARHIDGITLDVLAAKMGILEIDNKLTVSNTGYIHGGALSFNDPANQGFFLGYESNEYVFSIGNGTDNFLSWDGNTLQVIGDILVGVYSYSTNAILSANTERSVLGLTYVLKKSFTIDRSGTVRVSYLARQNGGGTPTNGNTPTGVQIYVNGVLKDTQGFTNTSYGSASSYIATVGAGDVITMKLRGGTRWFSGDSALDDVVGYFKDCQIQADVALTTGGSVGLD